MPLRTTDNNGSSYLVPDECLADLAPIAGRTVGELCAHNPGLLVFPHSLDACRDIGRDSTVFTLCGNKLATRNIMGFVGRNATQLTVSSRFARDDRHDYFLHYMLQRVFAINIFDFDRTSGPENIWDFLPYLFPHYLKRACAQGLYKTYRRTEHNDADVRGAIDVERHLRVNVPFSGRIAYTAREYSHDNALTQLVRHTVEHIAARPGGLSILSADSATRDAVSLVRSATQPSYDPRARRKVIAANLRPVSHPYFTEYRPLQTICLRILRREGLTFGESDGRIHGLLFDGAWLWEEYLNTLLHRDFIHPENRTGRHRRLLFENFQSIYPDFISRREPATVGDAKYIPLEQRTYAEDSERATSIYYKTIAYMYRFESRRGLLLFPSPDTPFHAEYRIKDTDGVLHKIGLAVPQQAPDFRTFRDSMSASEEYFLASVRAVQ